MIKHIFCDLDGTLLKNFHKIDDEDIEALKLAQEKGITISIATGRLDYEIKKIMDKYQLKGYRISQNGAVVFDEYDQLVYEKCLSHEDSLTILNALKGHNIIIFFQTIDTYIVEEKLPLIVEFEKSQSLITYIENKNILHELDKHQFVSISIWAEIDYNIELKKQLDKVLPPHLISYVSSKYTLDITNVENSKGNGIKQICQKNYISLNEIAVIGDSQNDISMFNITDYSYVMNEANLEVKQHAQFCIENVKNAVLDILKNR